MSNNIEVDNRFAELVFFIRDKTGVHEMPITRDTLIEDDLGVTGDDADDLLKAFSEKYNVDISNFNLQNRTITPFNIGHLEKGIIAGRLDEEVINS
jgi:Protein of unknown function (DUF1493)